MKGKRVGVIGGGAIGGAVIDRLLGSGISTTADLRVCETREERRRELATHYGVEAAAEPAGAAAADLVVLAVPPGAMAAVLDVIRPHVGPGQVVVSFAGGVPLAYVESRLAAGVPVVRVNPNSPSIVGLGYNPVTYGGHAEGPARALADQFLATLGRSPAVPDRLMNLYTALTAVGPTYILPVLEALVAAGVAGGLGLDEARAAAAATAIGTGEMLQRRGEPPEQLKLLTGLRPLDDQESRRLVEEAIRAALLRMEQVERGFSPAP